MHMTGKEKRRAIKLRGAPQAAAVAEGASNVVGSEIITTSKCKEA
jgi:hypothetical protein